MAVLEMGLLGLYALMVLAFGHRVLLLIALAAKIHVASRTKHRGSLPVLFVTQNRRRDESAARVAPHLANLVQGRVTCATQLQLALRTVHSGRTLTAKRLL